MFNELFKAIYGWVSYSIYQKTVSTTIFRQLVPQKAAKGVGVLRIIKKKQLVPQRGWVCGGVPMANYGELWRIMAKVFMANWAKLNCAIRHNSP